MRAFLRVFLWSTCLFYVAGMAHAGDKKPTPKAEKTTLQVVAKRDEGKRGQRPSPTWHVKIGVKGKMVKITYARPAKRQRKIFGALVPFGQVWRTGANEASIITFPPGVKLAGKPIKPGAYALFSIPGPKHWIIILNHRTRQWGSYGYSAAKDLARVKVPVETLKKPAERFTITGHQSKGKSFLVIKWDTVQVKIPLSF